MSTSHRQSHCRRLPYEDNLVSGTEHASQVATPTSNVIGSCGGVLGRSLDLTSQVLKALPHSDAILFAFVICYGCHQLRLGGEAIGHGIKLTGKDIESAGCAIGQAIESTGHGLESIGHAIEAAGLNLGSGSREAGIRVSDGIRCAGNALAVASLFGGATSPAMSWFLSVFKR